MQSVKLLYGVAGDVDLRCLCVSGFSSSPFSSVYRPPSPSSLSCCTHLLRLRIPPLLRQTPHRRSSRRGESVDASLRPKIRRRADYLSRLAPDLAQFSVMSRTWYSLKSCQGLLCGLQSCWDPSFLAGLSSVLGTRCSLKSCRGLVRLGRFNVYARDAVQFNVVPRTTWAPHTHSRHLAESPPL